MKSPLFIGRKAALVVVLLFAVLLPARAKEFHLATFSADVTPPLGHPLMAGGTKPAAKISDPLFARGWVLLGGDNPVVFVAVDWCEIRNEAYDRWREALAQAAETDATRVMVTAVHVHDAPVADLEAQRILEDTAASGKFVISSSTSNRCSASPMRCGKAFPHPSALRISELARRRWKRWRRIAATFFPMAR